MGFSKREKIILIFCIVAVLALIADRYVFSAMMEGRSELKDQRQELLAELEESRAIIERRKLLSNKWDQMIEAGLKGNPSETEVIVLGYIKDSSSNNNVKLASIQPERIQENAELGEIEFVLSGVGSISSVTGFLWDIETSPIPLKVATMQLSAADESGNQMTIQLRISSIYYETKTK
ncbi:MAG: hypothetical protein KAS23_01820 [Anaerohalosphaera sp.]|nr:hypothetical protein [Anaerohalosphaera sp.]